MTQAAQIPQFYMDTIVQYNPDAWILEDPNTSAAPVNYSNAIYGATMCFVSVHCVSIEKVDSRLFRDLEKHASGNKTLADFSQDTHDQTIRWMAESALQNPVLNTTPIDATWQWFALPPQ